MKKKVSLIEIVSMKILLVVIVAGYYWLWSRSDWRVEYQRIQDIVGYIFLIIYGIYLYRLFKYKKEDKDELAIRNLQRCDAICLKILIVLMTITAYLSGILAHINAITPTAIGWIIMGLLIGLTIFRTVLFILMDKKGI